MARFACLDRKVIAWAMYDWANSAFALSVLAVLFPLFLGSYWSAGDAGSSVTARLAWVTAGSSALVCVFAPIVGTLADKGGYRKRFLVVLAAIGAIATAALAAVGEGDWPWALGCYTVASIGFYSSTVFYDSLIIDVTTPRYYGIVSSLGLAAGYLGSALLLTLHVWMLTSPSTFGLSGTAQVMRFAFMSVGVWWLLFLGPLLVFVPENYHASVRTRGIVRAAYAQLRATIAKIGLYRNIAVFLLAYWMYVGAVFTVIFMAVNYGQRLGFAQQDLVMALLITNFVGFPATVLYGLVTQRVGAKPGIYFALSVYVVVSIWAAFMHDVREFYAMAIIIGCVQGGVQALSRSLFASLIPAEQPGEFFGFYNMITKFSHVLGPVFVGVAALVSDKPQWVLLILLPLFIVGGLLLTRVQVPHDAKTQLTRN